MQKDILLKNQTFIDWYKRWKKRLKQNNNKLESYINLMQSTNPLIIPRNHKVEEALNAATANNDLVPFHNLLKVLKKPYKNHSEIADYQSPPLPSDKAYKTFCGT